MDEPPKISLQSLRGYGVVPSVAKTLRRSAAAFAGQLFSDVIEDVEAFTLSANPDILPELRGHLDQLIQDLCQKLAGSSQGDLEFVREHARQRAQQKFPLDALLQSIRRMQPDLDTWIRDAALTVAGESVHVRRVVAAVSGFTNEYCAALCTVMTSGYVHYTRVLAEEEGDRRTELFNLLLHGYDESDSYAANLLRRAGYLEQRQSFCIVAAQSVEPREMQSTARAQRMADSLGIVLADFPIRTLVGIRDNLVIVIVSGMRRLSGWTAPQSLLADRIYPPLRQIGPAALIGMSADVPSTSHIPRALSEAKLALDMASVADRVMPFSRIPFRQLLVCLARDDIQFALPAWLAGFMQANKKSRGALLRTLRAYADANMNVLQTAKALSLHPNTIYARLQKIDDITGRNALAYNALTELLLAADCAATE